LLVAWLVAAGTAATHGCAAVPGGDSALIILRLLKKMSWRAAVGKQTAPARSANAASRNPLRSRTNPQSRKKVICSMFPHVKFNPVPEDATHCPTAGLSPRPPGRRGSKTLQAAWGGDFSRFDSLPHPPKISSLQKTAATLAAAWAHRLGYGPPGTLARPGAFGALSHSGLKNRLFGSHVLILFPLRCSSPSNTFIPRRASQSRRSCRLSISAKLKFCPPAGAVTRPPCA